MSAHLRFLEWLGKPLPPGERVLDFGCGIGHSVDVLLDMGYDVYGVDVVDWWDRDDYWDKSYVPGPRVRERLRCIKEANYRIPFPDGHFEFCFSDQVVEHVHDYTAVFGEIVRVLEPQAVSLHRFPGPNMLVEGHVFLPFPVLCYYNAYLAMCAMLGRRSPDQKGLTWRQTLASNIVFMKQVSYPRKASLRRHAAEAGVCVPGEARASASRLWQCGQAGEQSQAVGVRSRSCWPPRPLHTTLYAAQAWRDRRSCGACSR
jgi:SAM-dependent methyltransferase